MDFQHATVEVDVRPFQSQQFAPPQAGGQIDVVQGEHAAVPGLAEEGAELISGQRFHFLVFDFRQGAALCRVFAHQLLLHSEIVRRADHLVDVPHRFWSQTFRFLFRLDAVYPTAVQQVLVEPLQVQRGQVCQRDATDLRLDVVLQKALRGLERGRAQLDFRVVFQPDFQPATHRVGLGPSVVDADVFLDGFFQFLLHFCLCFAEDVLDDGLPCFGIVADCVAALPASVLAFSDVALAVCSSFWHGISPFRNEQYRNQGDKATEKRNCYQKVIICA